MYFLFALKWNNLIRLYIYGYVPRLLFEANLVAEWYLLKSIASSRHQQNRLKVDIFFKINISIEFHYQLMVHWCRHLSSTRRRSHQYRLHEIFANWKTFCGSLLYTENTKEKVKNRFFLNFPDYYLILLIYFKEWNWFKPLLASRVIKCEQAFCRCESPLRCSGRLSS